MILLLFATVDCDRLALSETVADHPDVKVLPVEFPLPDTVKLPLSAVLPTTNHVVRPLKLGRVTYALLFTI